MSIQSGSQCPYPEFRGRYAPERSSPVIWQWQALAEELDTAEHTERGSFALSIPDGTTEIVPGTALAFQVVKAGGRTAAHAHSWWHLYFVRSGAGSVVFDEQHEDAELNGGDILLIPAWVAHHFENQGAAEDLVLLNLLNIPQQANLGNVLSQDKEVVDAIS